MRVAGLRPHVVLLDRVPGRLVNGSLLVPMEDVEDVRWIGHTEVDVYVIAHPRGGECAQPVSVRMPAGMVEFAPVHVHEV